MQRFFSQIIFPEYSKFCQDWFQYFSPIYSQFFNLHESYDETSLSKFEELFDSATTSCQKFVQLSSNIDSILPQYEFPLLSSSLSSLLVTANFILKSQFSHTYPASSIPQDLTEIYSILSSFAHEIHSKRRDPEYSLFISFSSIFLDFIPQLTNIFEEHSFEFEQVKLIQEFVRRLQAFVKSSPNILKNLFSFFNLDSLFNSFSRFQLAVISNIPQQSHSETSFKFFRIKQLMNSLSDHLSSPNPAFTSFASSIMKILSNYQLNIDEFIDLYDSSDIPYETRRKHSMILAQFLEKIAPLKIQTNDLAIQPIVIQLIELLKHLVLSISPTPTTHSEVNSDSFSTSSFHSKDNLSFSLSTISISNFDSFSDSIDIDEPNNSSQMDLLSLYSRRSPGSFPKDQASLHSMLKTRQPILIDPNSPCTLR